MLEAALYILTLQCRGIDSAFELLIVKVPHAAVGIRLLENYRAVEAFHLGEIRFGENMSLKIYNHHELPVTPSQEYDL
jgi:hypothetical protein